MLVARESGWGLLLGRKEGRLDLRKGPAGTKGGEGARMKVGAGRMARGHEGALTPPKRRLPSRPSGADPSDARAAPAVTIVSLHHILPPYKAHGRQRCRGQSPAPRAASRLPGLLVGGQRLLGGGLRQPPASPEPPGPAADGYHRGLPGARPPARTHERRGEGVRTPGAAARGAWGCGCLGGEGLK